MNKDKKQNIQPLLLILSCLLITFAHPSFQTWLCPFVAIAYGLFWFSVSRWGQKKIFKAAFLWFFIAQLFHLSWMRSDLYQGFYTHIFYLVIAVALSMLFAVSAVLGLRVRYNHWIFSLYMASVGVVFEFVRLLPFCGFSWNAMSWPMAMNVYSLQLASFGGVYFCSFVLLLVNGLFFQFLTTRKIQFLMCFCGVLLGVYLYGAARLNHSQAESKALNVLILETNLYPYVGVHEKQLNPWDRRELIRKELNQFTGCDIDLIVLPEGILPFDFNKVVYVSSRSGIEAKESNAQFLSRLSSEFNCPIIAGAEYADLDYKNYNTAMLISGENYTPYAKRSLIPVAESIPFDFLRPIAKVYGIVDSYEAGGSSILFSSPAKIAPSVCYDESHPYIMREGRLLGAELFVNITNDIWYPNSNIGKEHFIFSKLRAVENGIPLIKSCNAGVSGAIDPFGRVIAQHQLPFSSEQVHGVLVNVPLASIETFYARFGDAWFWGFTILVIVFSHLQFRSSFKSNLKREK